MTKPKKSKRHEQTYIPGTEPVDVPSAVRDAVHQWLDDKDEHRQVGKRVRMSHDVMIAQMAEHKVDRAPYVDSISGKKKHVYADKTPKAKVINAPRPSKSGKPGKGDRDYDRPAIDAEIVDPNADKVESRRVSRASVADEIGEGANADPFARVRGLMKDANDVPPPTETEH